MESLYKLLEDIEAETETVIDNLVTGIKTLLNMMSITLQNSKERDQEDLSGHMDSVILPLNKGKAKDSTPQEQKSKVFNDWIKTPIGMAKVYNTFFMTILS